MGHESNSGPMVAYIDGQPVEIVHPLPKIAPDFSAGSVSAEDAAETMATASKVWGDLSITMEVAAEGIAEFFHTMELASAVWLARIFEPEMVHRYVHTKKKRTRKKYEKRILAWFREVLG